MEHYLEELFSYRHDKKTTNFKLETVYNVMTITEKALSIRID